MEHRRYTIEKAVQTLLDLNLVRGIEACKYHLKERKKTASNLDEKAVCILFLLTQLNLELKHRYELVNDVLVPIPVIFKIERAYRLFNIMDLIQEIINTPRPNMMVPFDNARTHKQRIHRLLLRDVYDNTSKMVANYLFFMRLIDVHLGNMIISE